MLAVLVLLCLFGACATEPPAELSATNPAGTAVAPAVEAEPVSIVAPSLAAGAYTVRDTFVCEFAGRQRRISLSRQELTLKAFLCDRGAGDDTFRPSQRIAVARSGGETSLTVYLPAPGAYRVLAAIAHAGGEESLMYEITATEGIGDAEFLFALLDPFLRADDAASLKGFANDMPYAQGESMRSFVENGMLRRGTPHWRLIHSSATREGETLFLRAAALGKPGILAFCLDSAVDIDQADSSGMTGLMRAARAGGAAAVRLLRERDADIALRSAEGLTALEYARRAGNAETVAVLEDSRYARPLAEPGRFVGEWKGQILDFFVGYSLEARLFLDGAVLRGEAKLTANDDLTVNGQPVAPEALRYSVKLFEKSGKILLKGLRVPEDTVRIEESLTLCGALGAAGRIAGVRSEQQPYSLFSLDKQDAPLAASPSSADRGKKLSLTCAAFPEYHYTCYIPTTYVAGTPAPLVIFDNAGGKADPLMPAAAEELGWISVGLAESSNTNVVNLMAEKNEACCFAVLLDLKRRLSIDSRRIYYAGFSGGAFRSHARAIRFLDEPGRGVLDIGMGFPIAPQHGIPVFYIMGEKDPSAKELIAGFPELQAQHGNIVALRTHPGGHVWGVPAALTEGMRWLAKK